MEQKIQEYTPSSRDLEWARKYKQDLRKRDDARKHKQQYALYMWVTLSLMCHAIFHVGHALVTPAFVSFVL